MMTAEWVVGPASNYGPSPSARDLNAELCEVGEARPGLGRFYRVFSLSGPTPRLVVRQAGPAFVLSPSHMTTDRRPAADQRTAAEKPPYKLSIHVMRVLMVANGTQYTSHVATCYPAPAVRTRVTMHRISSDRCVSTFLSSAATSPQSRCVLQREEMAARQHTRDPDNRRVKISMETCAILL